MSEGGENEDGGACRSFGMRFCSEKKTLSLFLFSFQLFDSEKPLVHTSGRQQLRDK